MSAKDAPGEVNKNPNFDSPNITSAADEVMEMIDAEKAARKKAETVEIDGVPIDEKEVKFKAEDIKKKGKTEYFVNVEGAEQRKREAQRRARLEAEEAKKRAKADDERVINELHKKAEQRKKENREVEQKAKAEDNRVIGELHKKAEQRKKENRAAERQERRKKIKNSVHKHKKILKCISITIIGFLIVVIVAVVINYIANPPKSDGYKADVEKGKETEKIVQDFNSVYEYYDSQTENLGGAYAKACEMAEEIINSAEDNKTKFAYVLQYASFITNKSNNFETAIELLEEYADLPSTDEEKYSYYSSLAFTYGRMGDIEKMEEYLEISNNYEVVIYED